MIEWRPTGEKKDRTSTGTSILQKVLTKKQKRTSSTIGRLNSSLPVWKPPPNIPMIFLGLKPANSSLVNIGKMPGKKKKKGKKICCYYRYYPLLLNHV